MKRWFLRLGALLVLLATGGFLVALSGLVPIKASSGHWPITEWFMPFAMKRSIATHSLLIDAPALDERALRIKGASYYHWGCRSCHGSPDQSRPVIAQHMLPAALYLPDRIAEWKPEQLFYIAKHGVKLTGMPAWPARQRDDEVWAIVAFLLELPGLDAAAYRQLAVGEDPALHETANASESLLATLRGNCSGCHGADGLGRGEGLFPRLAGQRAGYLRHALEAYARGERHSGVMQPLAASLAPETIRELANHFAALPPYAVPSRADPAAVARGELIARNGIPSQRVPSCVDCHGPNMEPRNDAYPLHAGQDADYLFLQLELFKQGRRGGSPFAELMRPIAKRLSVAQMRDVALYYTSLRAQ